MEFSKDKFLLIIENINEAYFEVDLKGNFTFFNDSLCRLTGYSREELLGLSYKSIADEENSKIVYDGFNSVYNTGVPLNDFEYQFKNKAGEKVIGETSVYLKHDSNGNKVGFYGLFRDITKKREEEIKYRKELEQIINLKTQELRESEEIYRPITDQSLLGICIIQDDLIKYMNQKLADLIGYTVEEVKNWEPGWFVNVIHFEDRGWVVEQARKKQAGAKDVKHYYQYRLIKKTGETIWLENFSKTILYKGRSANLVTVIDITERKSAEKKLMESEEKFYQLFNKAPYPIGLFDLEGNLLDCNSASNTLLSTHTLEDYVGKNYRVFWSYNDKEKPLIDLFNKIFTELIKTGKTLNFEFPIHRTIGPVIWNSATASKIRIGTNEFIQIVLMDISAQKETQQKLKESEEKYRNLVENAHEGVWAVDKNDITIFVNPKLCEMLGYTREELMGKSLHLFLKDSMIELIDSYRKRREKGFKDTYELDLIKKDGTLLSTSINAAPIFNESGEFKGSFAFINDITNRKIAEQKLRESEEKYRIISENANDLITITDTKMKIEYINEQVHKRVMGYVEDDVIGRKGLDLIHPDDREIVLREFVKSFKSRGGFVEARIKNKDGRYVWTETSGSAIKDKNEELKILLITRVTEERKKTEQKLKESEEKYRNMINHLDLGFYQLNWEGLLVNHNPRFCEILGYDSSEDLINKDIHEFWQKPEEREVYLTELKNKGFVKNYIVNAVKKNGEKIVVQINSHIIRKNEAIPVLIQGVISDITEKFELEKKLKESELRYRNLIESVPFSIALIDKLGKIVYCNPSIEKMLGFRRDELVGFKFKDLPAIHPDYVPILLKRFRRVLLGEILPPLEMQLYKKNGSLIWIEYQSSLVKLGNEILLQTVINDITEQKQADLLIEEEIIKLKELDQIRKDLISRVSHELKTPLVSVCGAAELLLDSFIDQFKDEPKELIEMIEKGGKRLKYLVDNLVDITRIEYQKFKLEKDLYDFSQIIKECIKELMYLIRRRDLTLKLDIADSLYLEIDRIRMEQVILNLLSNAIKNTPPNGNITVRLKKIDNWVEISVSDTGIGLTTDEMNILFTRFGKLERYGNGLEYINIQGSGLGLFISKEIVNLHGGTIRAESEGRNMGSSFIVKLPYNSLHSK
ncbi:MAG: PAS domain S-box protein [Promethearchaeota archaeon]